MVHNSPVAGDYKTTIRDLADLMQEFRLTEARLQTGDLTIAFRRRPSAKPTPSSHVDAAEESELFGFEETSVPSSAPSAPKGTPVTSPMTGIFYGSSSPGAPAFAKEGESVSAGQVVGLIEAMKVFNEIPCPVSGTVLQVVAQSGQIVNPGDVLMYVG